MTHFKFDEKTIFNLWVSKKDPGKNQHHYEENSDKLPMEINMTEIPHNDVSRPNEKPLVNYDDL